MAQENRMTVMAGSDEVYDDMSARVLSIADNDDALNDGDNQTRNAQQRHGYCTKRCKILCLAVVSVIAAVVAAVIAAVLIPKYLNQNDTVTVMTNKSVNGSWGPWSPFYECSRSCGNGTQARHRACDSPAASHGGFPCPGELEEAQNCNNGPCPVNGGWGLWTPFTYCLRTTGRGMQTRQRVCDNPNPSNGGALCHGDSEGRQTCNSDPCPEDCPGFSAGDPKSGGYHICRNKIQTDPVPVYCDFTSDGAWTVIQKRFDGSVDFNRTWEEYKSGFGAVNGEYWLGNDAIYKLTSQGHYQLKVLLTDWNNVTKFATYTTFRISNESDNYRMTIDGYSGDAGDSMEYHNGEQFSTPDTDNDGESSVNCAKTHGRGGWWYSYCSLANLNGEYYHSPRTIDYTGVWWNYWHGWYYSLKATTMMVRKT